MQRSTSRSAMIGAFFVALAGCQLFTSTYDVANGSLGPICSAVALCCGLLTGSQATTCESYTGLENEQVCSAFLQALPSAACSAHDGGGVMIHLPDLGDSGKNDGTTNHMDANGPRHDASVGGDASGEGGSIADPLDGTWTLSVIECMGSPLGSNGSTTLTFSGTTVLDSVTLADGCVITNTFTPTTFTTSNIITNGGSASCGISCTATDCTAGAAAALDLPYTLSSSALTLSLATETTTCSSGTLTYVFTQN